MGGSAGGAGDAGTSCVPDGEVDEPDVEFRDSNCDGIDGDASLALFVALGGDDANDGTRAAPLRTVGAAVTKAVLDGGIQHIYVASGQYDETVILADGISIWGGFSQSADWQRGSDNVTEIHGVADASGDIVTVHAAGITKRTVVADVSIVSAAATVPGASSIGVFVDGSAGLTLERLLVEAGLGAPGADGADGLDGDPGGDGEPGKSGTCSSGCTSLSGPPGGAGGESSCGVPGQSGLVGGGATNNPGGSCSPVTQGGNNGTNGADGDDGTAGAAGTAGSGGGFVAGRWVGGAANEGVDGTSGTGGGRGTGGWGFCSTSCGSLQSGPSGGGGGGGGCMGTAGAAGGAGGGSFGMVLMASPLSAIRFSTITALGGGAGGDGGRGGRGGLGGSGGAGSTMSCGNFRSSGSGGDGGNGGDAGPGGGGVGGPSFALWVEGGTPTLDSNSLSFGTPGAGGASDGNPGSTGEAGEVKNLP